MRMPQCFSFTGPTVWRLTCICWLTQLWKCSSMIPTLKMHHTSVTRIFSIPAHLQCVLLMLYLLVISITSYIGCAANLVTIVIKNVTNRLIRILYSAEYSYKPCDSWVSHDWENAQNLQPYLWPLSFMVSKLCLFPPNMVINVTKLKFISLTSHCMGQLKSLYIVGYVIFFTWLCKINYWVRPNGPYYKYIKEPYC